jgi:hypothetical protein
MQTEAHDLAAIIASASHAFSVLQETYNAFKTRCEVNVPLYRLVCIVLVLLSVPVRMMSSQAQQPSVVAPYGEKSSTVEKERLKMEREAAKRANAQRQAELKRDTEKLFSLATELKSSVEKTSTGILSVEVVKKAEEIEKLAHSVKEKMKNSY